MHKYSTISNPKGLCALSVKDKFIIVIPYTEKGKLRVENISDEKSIIITAHENGIQCFCLNMDGSLIATASEKGTLIRIWDVNSGDKLQELRRGKDKAIIYSIAFSKDSKFLCCSSDKGTIHVFNVSVVLNNKEEEIKQNRTSTFGFLGGYFKSQWSFAWYNGPEVPSICCFGDDEKINCYCYN